MIWIITYLFGRASPQFHLISFASVDLRAMFSRTSTIMIHTDALVSRWKLISSLSITILAKPFSGFAEVRSPFSHCPFYPVWLTIREVLEWLNIFQPLHRFRQAGWFFFLLQNQHPFWGSYKFSHYLSQIIRFWCTLVFHTIFSDIFSSVNIDRCTVGGPALESST